MVPIKLSELHNNNFNQDKCLALKIKKQIEKCNTFIREGLCIVIMKVLVGNSNTVIIIIYFTKIFF